MNEPLEHSFEVRKTILMSEKDATDSDGLSLEMLDTTCVLSYRMNRNNVLEGNNLIYINGAYLTFYNFFQNTKQFCTLVSPYRPVGMVGNSAGRGSVAVVVQSEDKSEMHISVYAFCEELVPTHRIKKPLLFVDVLMVRSNYLIVAAVDPKTQQNLVYVFNGKMIFTVQFAQKIGRMVSQENRTYVLFEEGGMYQLDTEKTVPKQQIEPEFRGRKVCDYIECDNENRIVLFESNVLYCYWFETERQFNMDFTQQLEPNSRTHRIIKVGRNILVAHRNSLTISHFMLGEENLVFVANHTYPEKLRAGIVSVEGSQDEMHAALAVEITERDETKIQNFIFNLSSISKSHKLMNPFSRVMPMGAEFGNHISFENALSSNCYQLVGSKIYNLFCSTSLERKKMYNLYETPKFMTVHPLGYQFLCGFDNIIKFYNKVEKELQEVWNEQFVCTAAKYSKSGGLVLSCIEDSLTSLVLYDCYNFRKIRNIPVSYLKLHAIRIEWADNNLALVLSSSSELVKVNVYTGQKMAEFKERKEIHAIRCIEYDMQQDKAVLATSTNSLVIAGKGENSSYLLSDFRCINLPEEITCIRISSTIKTIFLGGRSGTLYWSSYPLKIRQATHEQVLGTYSLNGQLNSMKLHSSPITSIDLANNSKFMVVSFKGHGSFNYRVRKIRTKENGAYSMNSVFQELGSLVLNTIDTSSTLVYGANKEKLKIALEKRKECFSDLDEFRRQWELKSALTSKKIEMTAKRNELVFINDTLDKLTEIKDKKKDIMGNLEKVENQIEEMKVDKEDKFTREMLELYEETAHQKQILDGKKNEYNRQYQKLVGNCKENLKEIEKQLTEKRFHFEQNYNQMLKNLFDFKKRYEYERQQQEEEQKLQIQEYLKSLQLQQIQLNSVSNDLSVKITQAKKQYQRYTSRKSFLEHKNIFFLREIDNCVDEKSRLLELRDKLEKQLHQLEICTDKKEKKLRNYLKANQALTKYKEIHEDMAENAHRETQFIRQEKEKIDLQIVEIQKQLSSVSSYNESAETQISFLAEDIEVLKNRNYTLNLKMKDIGFYLNEILASMENVGECSEAEKRQKLKAIYQYFYVERSVEQLIEKYRKNQPAYTDEFLREKNEKQKNQQQKIVTELSNQKEYILKNMEIFKTYNKRVNEEINLNFLQIQAQNYNLIAECNLRKQQTANKKRVLHELIDSVKETQIYLDEMKRDSKSGFFDRSKAKSKKKHNKSTEMPFALYEKAKEERQELIRVKSSKDSIAYASTKPSVYNKQFRPSVNTVSSSKANFSVRKVLDVKGFGESLEEKPQFRRIQTAKYKKTPELEIMQNEDSTGVIKPFTATFKKRSQREALKSAIPGKSCQKTSENPAVFVRSKPSLAI